MNKLEPFQEEVVDFMLSRAHSLNACDMGTGKTVMTIECFNRIPARRILIICLASVKYYWETMIRIWAIDHYYTQIIYKRSDHVSLDAEIIIVNYELLLSGEVFPQLQKLTFDIGVVDECHYLQTLTSKRSKRVLGRNGLLKNCKYKFLLSGTPMAARPINLFPILYTLANYTIAPYNSYELFAKRFCGAYPDGFGGLITRGATHLDDLKERLKSFMIRRTDVGNLPDVVYDIIPFEPNQAVKEVIGIENSTTMYKEKIARYRDLNNLGDLASLRQQVAIAKLPECIQFIEDTLKTVDKLVIFYYHRKVGKILFREFAKSHGVISIHGGQSGIFKQDAVNNFINADKRPFKILLAQINAAGEAIDGLQKVCNHCIFVESSWIPKDILQAVGRLRRKGGLGKPIIAQFLAAAGTIEYQILNSMIKKRQIIREVIE